MLTDQMIQLGKSITNYGSLGAHHEHNDCIRMAYEWLDAQLKNPPKKCQRSFQTKHLVEEWCGRYVSIADVLVAAKLHPDIKGDYPCFNISAKLTEPSKQRLIGIGEAFTHYYNAHHNSANYTYKE